MNKSFKFVTYVLFLWTFVLISSCSWVNEKLGKENDWWGEECLEGLIHQQLDVDVDLTPESPEGRC